MWVRFLSLSVLLACAAPPQEVQPRQPAPVPVSGGTLERLDDGGLLVLDAARDRLWVVDVDEGLHLRQVIDLPIGARPRRAAGTWVTVRGGLAKVDVRAGTAEIVPVCLEPQGVDVDGDEVWVACADGELVRLDAGGVEQERRSLEDDLRDVVVVDGVPWVSRFRAAEVLQVEADGVRRQVLPRLSGSHPSAGFEPGVAWRMVADPIGGGVLIAHQRAQPDLVRLGVDAAFGLPAYGGPGCDAVVQSAVTRLLPDGETRMLGPLMKSVLPVDLAPHPDGRLLVVAAGAGGLSDVAVGIAWPDEWDRAEQCTMLSGLSWSGLAAGGGRVAAAVWTEAGIVALMQAPLSLALAPAGGVVDRLDLEAGPPHRGVELFHLAPTGSVACASCHPEGREDGRTWRFELEGAEQLRRTQTLAGGIPLYTAPLHWDGALSDMTALLHDTFRTRIGGELQPGDDAALAELLSQVPSPVREGAEEGRAIFERAGCPVCHAGDWMTDGLSHDVGTVDPDGPVRLQTPSLIGLGGRGPWMHDGCATTLEERFDPICGGTDHGEVAPADVAPLVAWLRGL